jgi:hypothetical protein
MHCDQCGKENRQGSKFCRSCGHSLSAEATGQGSGARRSSSNITWKSPIVFIVIGLIVLGGLFYAGTKAYAYYQVQSKISVARKLQTQGDYKGSIASLDAANAGSPTVSQKANIDGVRTDDTKFIGFKASFDNAVATETGISTASTTLSVSLQSALKDLQGIDSSYPSYKDVQVEMTKVQNALVTALQNESNTNKKAAADASALAEKNRQAAASAQAAKARAEANAQAAQSAADSATANADSSRVQAVLTSYCQQIVTLKSQYGTGNTSYAKGLTYKSSGSDVSAIVVFAEANTSYSAVEDAAIALTKNFTNMPTAYTTAASNLAYAADYSVKAVNLILDEISDGHDYSSTINSDAAYSNQYMSGVTSFISNNCQ